MNGNRSTPDRLTVAITLDGEPDQTLRALKWLLKALLRRYGVRVVELRPLPNEGER